MNLHRLPPVLVVCPNGCCAHLERDALALIRDGGTSAVLLTFRRPVQFSIS